MFAVIQVFQDFDYVEGAECIDIFSTQQEASDLIREIKSEKISAWKQRTDYIDQFVASLDLPQTDYEGWLKYLNKFFPPDARYILPQDFKKELTFYLREHHLVKLEGYDPPPVIFDNNNLFVVEIKNKETTVAPKTDDQEVGA